MGAKRPSRVFAEVRAPPVADLRCGAKRGTGGH